MRSLLDSYNKDQPVQVEEIDVNADALRQRETTVGELLGGVFKNCTWNPRIGAYAVFTIGDRRYINCAAYSHSDDSSITPREEVRAAITVAIILATGSSSEQLFRWMKEAHRLRWKSGQRHYENHLLRSLRDSEVSWIKLPADREFSFWYPKDSFPRSHRGSISKVNESTAVEVGYRIEGQEESVKLHQVCKLSNETVCIDRTFTLLELLDSITYKCFVAFFFGEGIVSQKTIDTMVDSKPLVVLKMSGGQIHPPTTLKSLPIWNSFALSPVGRLRFGSFQAKKCLFWAAVDRDSAEGASEDPIDLNVGTATLSRNDLVLQKYILVDDFIVSPLLLTASRSTGALARFHRRQPDQPSYPTPTQEDFDKRRCCAQLLRGDVPGIRLTIVTTERCDDWYCWREVLLEGIRIDLSVTWFSYKAQGGDFNDTHWWEQVQRMLPDATVDTSLLARMLECSSCEQAWNLMTASPS